MMLGHYAPWSAKLSGDNGFSIIHDKEQGGGMIGLRGSSLLSPAVLKETRKQVWALLKGIQRLGVSGNLNV